MKKVKGLVLESTGESVYLLTPGGEYLKLPSHGKECAPGEEIEFEIPQKRSPKKRYIRSLAFAACFLAVLALTFFFQPPSPDLPLAYLDLDINPSFSLHLDEKGNVAGWEPLSKDGEKVLESFTDQSDQLKGLSAEKALSKLLNECLAQGYLSAEKENALFISLAAPEDYPFTSKELRLQVEEYLLTKELDAYLRVETAAVREVKEARQENVSVNAHRLGLDLAEKGLREKGPPSSVQELLQKVPPAEVFEKDEFVGGRSVHPKKDDKPDIGPPEEIPPVQKEQEKQKEEKRESPPAPSPELPEVPGENKPSKPPTRQEPGTLEGIFPGQNGSERSENEGSSYSPGKAPFPPKIAE